MKKKNNEKIYKVANLYVYAFPSKEDTSVTNLCYIANEYDDENNLTQYLINLSGLCKINKGYENFIMHMEILDLIQIYNSMLLALGKEDCLIRIENELTETEVIVLINKLDFYCADIIRDITSKFDKKGKQLILTK